MKLIKYSTLFFCLNAGLGFISSCSQAPSISKQGLTLTDPNATAETKALYSNLKVLASDKLLFGHQDALAYGFGRCNWDTSFCDVKDVTGSYPAVYGWDIGHIEESGNIDTIPFKNIKQFIKEGYSRGGVITISWHELNPKEGEMLWSEDPSPVKVLEGGVLHEEFKRKLTRVGDFFRELTDKNGTPIPVIFRPYHEHNGDWFWWGRHNSTEAEYIALWHFTVHYLRDTLNIHQLIYAISPDRSRMKSATETGEFLYAYPGDEYVDIIGLDNYWDVGSSVAHNPNISRKEQDSLFINSLRTIARIAAEKGKIAALTETGNLFVKENDWFTGRISEPVKNDPLAKGIAYFLVWRNGYGKHYYVPYPGHPAAENFVDFKNDDMILFEDELPPMYK